jgi:CRISPR-associated protein Cas5h
MRLQGQFGHWRKWFTTTSALTYSFPPRTAIIGLLGAILGIDRKKLSELFPINRTRIAVCPINPIVKDRIPQNWRQGPIEIMGRKVNPGKICESFRQNLEVIRSPDYRIFFAHKDKALMAELVERLKNV